MKTSIFSAVTLCAITLLSACTCASKFAIVPMTPTNLYEDTYTIIWNGKSDAYRYKDGQYVRDPSYDYVFNVVQKRYQNEWKSVKSLHRNHPDYNFLAGQRSQSMYFELKFSAANNIINSTLKSSFGSGKGTTDKEFREQQIIIDLEKSIPFYNISSFAPYNKIKITQHYKYEEGLLTETVELYKEKNGVIKPFMKNEETAVFYMKGKLDKAPTTFN